VCKNFLIWFEDSNIEQEGCQIRQGEEDTDMNDMQRKHITFAKGINYQHLKEVHISKNILPKVVYNDVK